MQAVLLAISSWTIVSAHASDISLFFGPSGEFGGGANAIVHVCLWILVSLKKVKSIAVLRGHCKGLEWHIWRN